MRVFARDETETEAIASRVAGRLRGGDVLALEGPMGAGKTRFVRALVAAMGGAVSQVSSPTFVLMNIYQTARMPVFHLDAYRVASAEDFEAIGFSELLDQSGLVIVEWPSRVPELIPPDARRIAIEPDPGGTETGRVFESDLFDVDDTRPAP